MEYRGVQRRRGERNGGMRSVMGLAEIPGLRVTGRALVRHTPGPNSLLETQGHRA